MTETVLREIPYREVKEVDQTLVKSRQRISETGRIMVSRKAWAARGLMISAIIAAMIYNFVIAISVSDALVVYSTVMPVIMLGHLIVGWIFFKNRATGKVPNDLVSIIIPIYNQENLIERVVDAIFSSTYSNVEVLAVDDGSHDRTPEILDELGEQYSRLRVIHKPNGGKRSAVGAGFNASKGRFVLFIDSDSIIDRHAIEEFMKVFSANRNVGGVVANGRILNADKNLLTKCQDSWYDYCFNINKTTESTFGTVTCLSGCMAAYRREAVAAFMQFWAANKILVGDDSHLTTFVLASPWAKKELALSSAGMKTRLLKSMANYDDAEDRGLTSQAIATDWETVYAPTAVVYTDVPDAPKTFIGQQTRWRKGYLRSSFFLSAFFWRKNPVIAFLWYLEFMWGWIAPAVVLAIFIYAPIFLHLYFYPLSYLVLEILVGTAMGADYKFRDPSARHWMYKPVMNLISTFILSWILFPALWSFRKNEWGTR